MQPEDSHASDQIEDRFFLNSSLLLIAMSHPGRLMVLELISEKEWNVSDLAKYVQMSKYALSQHLKRLKIANIVQDRRVGSTVYYRCSSTAVSKVLTILKEIYDDDF